MSSISIASADAGLNDPADPEKERSDAKKSRWTQAAIRKPGAFFRRARSEVGRAPGKAAGAACGNRTILESVREPTTEPIVGARLAAGGSIIARRLPGDASCFISKRATSIRASSSFLSGRYAVSDDIA